MISICGERSIDNRFVERQCFLQFEQNWDGEKTISKMGGGIIRNYLPVSHSHQGFPFRWTNPNIRQCLHGFCKWILVVVVVVWDNCETNLCRGTANERSQNGSQQVLSLPHTVHLITEENCPTKSSCSLESSIRSRYWLQASCEDFGSISGRFGRDLALFSSSCRPLIR